MSTLGVFFIVFAVICIAVFVFAFRNLGPTAKAERRIIELEAQAQERD